MEQLKDLENCRVCVDINEWRAKATRILAAGASSAVATHVVSSDSYAQEECPPDAAQLGRSTWIFLHTMSTYYPQAPSLRQQRDMHEFLRILGTVYPCPVCAEHYQECFHRVPPTVQNRESLMRWVCERHNEVNERQGKPRFDCSRVFERWRSGPRTGECE